MFYYTSKLQAPEKGLQYHEIGVEPDASVIKLNGLTKISEKQFLEAEAAYLNACIEDKNVPAVDKAMLKAQLEGVKAKIKAI